VTVWPMVAEGPSAALRRASHSPTLGGPAGADETLAFSPAGQAGDSSEDIVAIAVKPG
jgi:hypothetical protein